MRGRRTGVGSSCDRSVIRLVSSRLPGKTWPVVTSTRSPCDGSSGEAVRLPRSEVVRGLKAAQGREVEGYNSRYRQVITAKPRGPLTADTVLCSIQHFWMRGSALEGRTSEHVLVVRASLRPRIVVHLWCRLVWGGKGVSNAEEE